jgi:hypothetical protein
MNLTWHIVKKDLRRLLVPLALWALLLLVQIFIGVRLLHGDGDNLEWFGRMSLYGYLFFALDLVVSYVLVAMLIHEDPLTGSQEFWLTRPISGGRLLAAKSLGAVLMFGVLPVAIWLPWWLASGYGWPEVAAAIFETLVLKWVVIIPASLLAALTANFSRYLTWTLATILLLVLGSALVGMSLPILQRWSDAGLTETRPWLTLVAAAMGVAVVVVCHQFLTRHTVRSFVIGGSGFVLVALTVVLWPWDLFKIESLPAARQSVVEDKISISVDRIRIGPPRFAKSDRYAQLNFQMTVHGIPDGLDLVGFWSRRGFLSEHTWRWPDGSLLKFDGYLGVPSDFEDWTDGAVRNLLGVQGLKPDSRRNELTIAIQRQLREGPRLSAQFFLSTEMAARMLQEPPAYTVKLNDLLVRPVVEYELPLRISARQQHGTNTLRIAQAERREDGRMFVNLIESKPDPRIDATLFTPSISVQAWDPKVYALVNREKNEAVLVLGYGSNQATRIGTVEIRWNTVAFSRPNEQHDGQWVPEPVTWFDGTVLTRVGFAEEGRISRELKVERFEATP